MTWAVPGWLWVLVPLVFVAIYDFFRKDSKTGFRWPHIRRIWAKSTGVEENDKWLQRSHRLLLWIGLMLCSVALARPQWGVIEEPVLDEGREVLVALDLSRSMLAEDVKPSRLERSKILLRSLLDNLQGERVGLVVFAGTAFLQSPLSSDYEILREFIPSLSPDFLPQGGTDYDGMLKTALEAFGQGTQASRFLVVISDGESHTDSLKERINECKKREIRVIGLGVGTPQGSVLPDGQGGLMKDERGAVVLSRLNPQTLQFLAQMTGGTYRDASGWVDIAQVIQQTVEQGLKAETMVKRKTHQIERFQIFLALALLFLGASLYTEFPARPRLRELSRRTEPGILTKKKIASVSPVAPVSLFVFMLALISLCFCSTFAQEKQTLQNKLPEVISGLSVKKILSAQDLAKMAEETIIYGKEELLTKEPADLQGVIEDALLAVDIGENKDPKAADWLKLREELKKLLQQNQQMQQQQKRQGGKDGGNSKENSSDPQSSSKDGKESSNGEENPSNQGNEKDQDSSGDRQEQREKEEKGKDGKNQKQKVGGKKDEIDEEMLANPQMADTFRKYEQVRDKDSPARLFQLMEGKTNRNEAQGRNW